MILPTVSSKRLEGKQINGHANIAVTRLRTSLNGKESTLLGVSVFKTVAQEQEEARVEAGRDEESFFNEDEDAEDEDVGDEVVGPEIESQP